MVRRYVASCEWRVVSGKWRLGKLAQLVKEVTPVKLVHLVSACNQVHRYSRPIRLAMHLDSAVAPVAVVVCGAHKRVVGEGEYPRGHTLEERRRAALLQVSQTGRETGGETEAALAQCGIQRESASNSPLTRYVLRAWKSVRPHPLMKSASPVSTRPSESSWYDTQPLVWPGVPSTVSLRVPPAQIISSPPVTWRSACAPDAAEITEVTGTCVVKRARLDGTGRRGRPALPGRRARATGRPSNASGSRARRLQARTDLTPSLTAFGRPRPPRPAGTTY